jgi:tripartite-type tricarboxylate transporter receptor subunit TctC
MTTLFRILLLILACTTGGIAAAETWPTRPVRVVVSLAAGGTPDILCRILADRLSRALGQQFVVENRPGGGNVIGAQGVARAQPDGYTLFFATAAALVSNPYTFKSLPYDPMKDFVPVAVVGKNPFLVLAHPDVPAKSLADLIAYDKSNPGRLAFSTDGPRNFSGMLIAWLNKVAGTQFVQVPYATMPQGVQDVIAGRVQLTILAIPSAAPQIGAGRLRPLALTFSQRIPQYPDLPTINETVPGVELMGWFALVAPAATPAAVIERLNLEMGKILADPDVAQKFWEQGIFVEGAGTPESAARFIRSQYELWGRVTREIGVVPE